MVSEYITVTNCDVPVCLNLKDWATQPFTEFLLPLTDFIWMLERIFNIFAVNLCLLRQINMCIISYRAKNQHVTPPSISEGLPKDILGF